MADFPAESFRLGGDPGAIESSAKQWATFGDAAAEGARQIRALDTSLFIGPEADQYREGLNDSLPPHLDTTGEAYNKVATALTGFAGELSHLQDQMRPLTGKAPSLWEALQGAQGRVSSAKTADKQHQQQAEADAATRPPDQPAPPDTYQSDSGAASTSLSAAQQAWNDCVNAANKVRTDHHTAIDNCDRAIRDAAGLCFAHNPHGFGAFFANVGDWIKDHAGELAKLSSILKTVSAITGVLSFIPGMGAVSLISGVLALGIDASIALATGGDLTNVLIEGAMMAVPFGAGKLLGKGIQIAKEARSGIKLVQEEDGIVTVVCNPKRWPQTAQHITEAQSGKIWKGSEFKEGTPKPDVLTIKREGSVARGRQAVKDVKPIPLSKNIDRDEYPPKVFAEGGKGASVKYINGSDNKGFGGHLGHALDGLPEETKVRIVVR